jgi:hypothetical protein
MLGKGGKPRNQAITSTNYKHENTNAGLSYKGESIQAKPTMTHRNSMISKS